VLTDINQMLPNHSGALTLAALSWWSISGSWARCARPTLWCGDGRRVMEFIPVVGRWSRRTDLSVAI